MPSIDYGGTGDELVFLHANGYPPNCYRPFLARLSEEFHVTAMVQRPLWPESNPADLEDWHPLTEDFLQFLDAQHPAQLVCVGHSMGGIALLRAALQEPDRFEAIVLLDPVLYPPSSIACLNLMRVLRLNQPIDPLVAGARNRRRQFDDLNRLFRRYRRKSIFRYMDDESLKAYVKGIACPQSDGGYRLCYSPEWEIRIYLTGIWRDMDIWNGLPNLKVPTLIVRGAQTETFVERTAKYVKRKNPEIRVKALEKSTHLLPLERPVEVSNLIRSFFEENA